MRFIVDLYRYLIYIFCGVAVIVTALVLFIIADVYGTPKFTTDFIAIGVGFVVFLLLALGGIAAIVSLHDRHVEISDTLMRIASALEKMADETAANDAGLR